MSVWPGRLARAGSGVLVLAVVAAVGAASWLAPVPGDASVEAAVLTVPAGPTTLVCPGPVVLPESDDDADPEFNPAPVGSVDRARLVAGASAGDGASGDSASGDSGAGSPGAVLEAWSFAEIAGPPALVADGSTATAGAGGRVGIASAQPTTALLARAMPVEGTGARVAGASASTVAAGDLRGAAAASCQRPASELWLVGGGTELGTTSLLVVHNPGATPAEIGIELWGPAGRVELGGGARYVVSSGGELSLRLSALAAELPRSVVRVTSAGGQISAFLQVSELDGFTPGGTDLVVPGQAPSTRQVLSSLVVPASEIEGPGAGLLRLLVPVGAGSSVEAGTGEVPGDDTAPGDEGPDEATDDAASDDAATDDAATNDAATNDAATDDAATDDAATDDDATDAAEGGTASSGEESDSTSEADDPASEQSADPTAGADEVPVRVTFYGASGPIVLPGTEELRLVPGEVMDVDLGGLVAGAYAVVVDADLPVLAGARVQRVGTPAAPGDPTPVEQAWIGAREAGGDELIAVPAGFVSNAVVSAIPAPGESTQEPVGLVSGVLRAFDESGAELIVEGVTLTAGTTVSVPLPEGTAAVELVGTTASEAVGAGAQLAWGVLVEAQGADGRFVSVLTPPVHGAAVGEVAVRSAQRLPIE